MERSRQDQHHKVGHAADIHSLDEIKLAWNILEALAESLDAHTGRSICGNLTSNIDTLVQRTDCGLDVNFGGKRDNGDMTRGSALAGEDTVGLSLLLVLQLLLLAGLVATVEFRL